VADEERKAPWLVALVWAARLGVAVAFLAAAVPKILDPAGFARAIANYQVFPYWSWNLLAGIVPMMELIGALGLLLGWKRRAAAVLLSSLTVAFLALILVTIESGLNVACGCFGASDEPNPVGWPLFWRDVLLLVGIVIAGIDPRRSRGN
jgi:uncharacterized membrane protein YphA (DoxX/SURF4 family)